MRASRDPVIAALRKFKPTRFLVTCGDDIKTIPLSTKANKWEVLLGTLNALRWERIEAQDDKGLTLGVLDREAEEESDEDVVVQDDIDKTERFAKILLVVVERCLAHSTKVTEAAVAALERSNGHSTNSVVAMERAYAGMAEGYQNAIRVWQAAGATGGGEADPVLDMMKMAMALRSGGGSSTPPTPRPPVPTPQAASKPNGKPADKRTAA